MKADENRVRHSRDSTVTGPSLRVTVFTLPNSTPLNRRVSSVSQLIAGGPPQFRLLETRIGPLRAVGPVTDLRSYETVRRVRPGAPRPVRQREGVVFRRPILFKS